MTQQQQQQEDPGAGEQHIITRAAVIKRIDARLSGQIGDHALASWAFDRFYAEEVGDEDYELGAEPMIADALDELMFGDEPGFALDEAELRTLRVRLGSL